MVFRRWCKSRRNHICVVELINLTEMQFLWWISFQWDMEDLDNWRICPMFAHKFQLWCHQYGLGRETHEFILLVRYVHFKRLFTWTRIFFLLVFFDWLQLTIESAHWNNRDACRFSCVVTTIINLGLSLISIYSGQQNDMFSKWKNPRKSVILCTKYSPVLEFLNYSKPEHLLQSNYLNLTFHAYVLDLVASFLCWLNLAWILIWIWSEYGY